MSKSRHTESKQFVMVITGPTNLYSQHYFPSLDFILSFHIGVIELSSLALRQSKTKELVDHVGPRAKSGLNWASRGTLPPHFVRGSILVSY